MSETPFDPATNARFELLDEGTYSERIAPMVTLYYDPTTQASRASFNSMPYLKIGSKYHSLGGSFDTLEVSFADRMTECFGEGTDPVTGADLSQISTAGVMTLLKCAFDRFIAERAASQAPAPPPEPEE